MIRFLQLNFAIVGRTPWSAADALVGLRFSCDGKQPDTGTYVVNS
jgi:hypothetical protein